MNFAGLALISNEANLAVASLLLAVTLPAVACLLSGWRRITGSTLIIPWGWAVGSFLLVAVTCVYAALVPPERRIGSFTAIQFVAACGTLCPLVALVGAKRPQHAAWNFVVLSLWGILALPAAEVILLQPGQQLEINSFRGWFLWALLAAELSCFALTRYGLSAVLLLSGQIFWLGDWLPLIAPSQALAGWKEMIGLMLVCFAIVMAWLLARGARREGKKYDRVWLDFRDAFGLFWALRLAERVNDAARQADWDFDLGWSGFRTRQDFAPLGELSPEVEEPLRNCLQGLLRRFVSREWLAARLGDQSAAEAVWQTPRPSGEAQQESTP